MSPRHPSVEERRRWSLFVAACAEHARALQGWGGSGRAEPSAEAMLKARRRVRKAIMPENQQSRSSALFQLLRLVDAWPALSTLARMMRVAELAAAAAETAEQIAPPAAERRRRADIDD